MLTIATNVITGIGTFAATAIPTYLIAKGKDSNAVSALNKE